jgi:arsenate reductase
MKKAFTWLDQHGLDYRFHDYKKHGLDEAVLRDAIAAYGWDNVINRRGTTWRNLPDDTKASMNDEGAVRIARENPSIIKRPLLAHNGAVYLGFKAEDYTRILGV